MTNKVKIEIDEKVFNFIKELAESLSTQDNRGTQDVAFVVTDVEKIYCSHDDDYEWVERDEDMLWNEQHMCEDCLKKYWNDELDNDAYCSECWDICFQYYITEQRTSEKAWLFLTEKACVEHIAQNHYHYSDKVSTYWIHLWRNYEMQMLINSVFEISWIKQTSNYSKLF